MKFIFILFAFLVSSVCFANIASVPIPIVFEQNSSQTLGIVITLTLIAILPGILVVTTIFTRIIIVLSMLRHAMGMQETPPNTVLIGLALFLTLLSMEPTFTQIEQNALLPLSENKISAVQGIKQIADPLKEHMITQTREQDMMFILELSNKPMPEKIDEVAFAQIVPAYMLSELRTAFMIGFMIFLPFLLVDIVISSILMSMGMMMVPPMTISLPIKILMFVLIDGWTLVIRSILSVGV